MKRFLVTQAPKRGRREGLSFIVVLIEAESAKEAIEKSGLVYEAVGEYNKPKAALAAFRNKFYL